MGECFPGCAAGRLEGRARATRSEACGLVELAVAVESVRRGRAPGTVGTERAVLRAERGHAKRSIVSGFAGTWCSTRIAFGGAHYACLLCHD